MTLKELSNQLQKWETRKYDLDSKIFDEENPEYYVSELLYNEKEDKFYIKFKE